MRLIESAGAAPRKASCQLHPRHPCRGAVAAFAFIARRDGGQRRRLSRGRVSWWGSAPAAAALRCSSSAPFAACRVRSVGAMDAIQRPKQRPSSLRSGRAPTACLASCRLYGGGIVPPRLPDSVTSLSASLECAETTADCPMAEASDRIQSPFPYEARASARRAASVDYGSSIGGDIPVPPF